MNHRKTGSAWEKYTVEHFSSRGYRVLETNFNCKFGEIDLIVMDGNILVFVEVKYRKNAGSGYPEEAVTYNKIRKICRSADYYRLRKQIPDDVPCRFDVVAIAGNQFRHYINAFDYVFM